MPSGVRRVVAGRGLVRQRRHVDVAVVFFILPAILPLLLSCQIWQKNRSQRGFYKVGNIHTHARYVYARAVLHV